MSPTSDRRVFLHVGAPKSGTTFLQRALWRHREEVLEAGILLPGESARDMFHAAIAVRGTYETWGREKDDVEATWQRLCAEARAFPGSTLMSHELLAAATEEQARRARSDLEGLDVHVVFTARDLARQVMSEWQERIKNGSKVEFERFQANVAKQLREDERSGLFWRYNDILGAFDRWGAGLPPENLHVVVVPQSGGDPLELWRRFGSTIGLDTARLDPTDPRGVTNESLGITQVAFLRRLNEALDGRIVQPSYARIVKRELSQKLLVQHPSPRLVCPASLAKQLSELASEWNDEIRTREYAVHGDLDELLPRPAPTDLPTPDSVEPEDVAELATLVVADLLVQKQEARRRRASVPPPRASMWRRARGAVSRLRTTLRNRR